MKQLIAPIAVAVCIGTCCVYVCKLADESTIDTTVADTSVVETPTAVVNVVDAETLAIDLIAKYEGFRATPYKCPAGKLTIGYGFTDKTNVSKKSMTKTEAKEILRGKVEQILTRVDSTLPGLNNYQRAALCSFIYNLGITNFNNSTMLKRLREGDFEAAAKECQRWNKANGKVLKGLVNRRAEEASMLLK